MKELTKEQRKELIKYMWDIGLLIQSKHFLELKTNKERCERIKSLINNGYRIQLFGKKFNIINLNGLYVSQELINELTEVYDYLIK